MNIDEHNNSLNNRAARRRQERLANKPNIETKQGPNRAQRRSKEYLNKFKQAIIEKD